MAGDTIRFLSMTNILSSIIWNSLRAYLRLYKGNTKNCVISFLDLYQKVKRNFPEVKMVSKEQRKYLGERMTRIATEHKMILRPCGEGTELAAFGADCNGCMTQQIYENAIHMSLDMPKNNSLEKSVHVIWEMILVLIIVVRICASIVMQIMMKKVCALIV